ncbi:MAG: response regulator [Clostridiales bacterium]|nr:response regulator [Clostridiales bacterium]
MKQVLLVDDEPEVLEGLVDILRPLTGVVLHTANRASKAIEMIENTRFNLVVADIRMPGMDGIEMWKQIQQRLPDCRVIFLSGVRDFDNIYQAIQNPMARFLTKMESEEKIFSTVQEVLAEIENRSVQVQEKQRQLLMDFLQERTTFEILQETLEKFSHPILEPTGMEAAYLQMMYAEVFSSQEIRQVFQEVGIWIQNREKRKEITWFLVGEKLVVLRHITSEKEDFFRLLEDGVKWGMERFRVLITAVYHEKVQGLEKLKETFHTAKDLTSPTFISEKPIIINLQSSIKKPESPLASQNKVKLLTLQGYLRLGQKENFLELFDTLLTKDFLGANETDHMLLQVYFSVLFMLYRYTQMWENTNHLKEEFDKHFSLNASRNTPWNVLIAHTRAYGMLLLEKQFPGNPYAGTDRIQAVQTYIQDHLAQDLSLYALSEKFFFHPNYLSRLFKDRVGVNLSDYVTKLRMGMAQRLLSTSHLSVSEIAEQTGYRSAHSFIRAFQKTYGQSPKAYRSFHLGKETK